jgi:hypothetical protein
MKTIAVLLLLSFSLPAVAQIDEDLCERATIAEELFNLKKGTLLKGDKVRSGGAMTSCELSRFNVIDVMSLKMPTSAASQKELRKSLQATTNSMFCEDQSTRIFVDEGWTMSYTLAFQGGDVIVSNAECRPR